MRVLRDNAQSLVTVVQVFVHNPLYKWALDDKKRDNQREGQAQHVAPTREAERALVAEAERTAATKGPGGALWRSSQHLARNDPRKSQEVLEEVLGVIMRVGTDQAAAGPVLFDCLYNCAAAMAAACAGSSVAGSRPAAASRHMRTMQRRASRRDGAPCSEMEHDAATRRGARFGCGGGPMSSSSSPRAAASYLRRHPC